jgi:hypothetical protein
LPRRADETPVDPTANAGQAHVAPAEAGNAAHHHQRDPARDLRDDRKIGGGSGVEVDGLVGESLGLGLCLRRRRKHAGQTGEYDTDELLTHRCFPLGKKHPDIYRDSNPNGSR